MNLFIPGLEPTTPELQQLTFLNGIIDLNQFEKIFICVSGGKDSHAMLFLIKDLCEQQKVPTKKLLALYADTGMEWHNAQEHVQLLCNTAGIDLLTVYPVRPMIEKIKFRAKRIQEAGKNSVAFPSPQCRWCTSKQKVAPMDKVIRKFSGKLLKITGERWEESKARSTYSEYVYLDQVSSKNRSVFGWRPMLSYSKQDIWSMIKNTGVERHLCYDLGCDRLGCAGCIFLLIEI